MTNTVTGYGLRVEKILTINQGTKHTDLFSTVRQNANKTRNTQLVTICIRGNLCPDLRIDEICI